METIPIGSIVTFRKDTNLYPEDAEGSITIGGDDTVRARRGDIALVVGGSGPWLDVLFQGQVWTGGPRRNFSRVKQKEHA